MTVLGHVLTLGVVFQDNLHVVLYFNVDEGAFKGMTFDREEELAIFFDGFLTEDFVSSHNEELFK